ncbi:MAG: hypothetical protein R3C18_26070 [Planctomycetaceae bacterium]
MGVYSRAFVSGAGSIWINDGVFAADVSVSAGGTLQTTSFVNGNLKLFGGKVQVRNYAPDSQDLQGGQLVVSDGGYRYLNTDVPNGAWLTLDKGTLANNLNRLTVGVNSLQWRGVVEVASGSQAEWDTINLQRRGELRISGSGSKDHGQRNSWFIMLIVLKYCPMRGRRGMR